MLLYLAYFIHFSPSENVTSINNMFRSGCTIICTDLLSTDLVACPCGHVYHNTCLSRWFATRKTCPTCRQRCNSSIKLFFSDIQESPKLDEDLTTIKNNLRKQMAITNEKDEEIKQLKRECAGLHLDVNVKEISLGEIKRKLEREHEVKEAHKKQVSFLNENLRQSKQVEDERDRLKKKLSSYQRIETLIMGTVGEADDMLRNIGTSAKIPNELASQLIIMKREHEKMRVTKKKAQSEKENIERGFNLLQHKLKTKEFECSKYTKEIESMHDQLKDVEDEKQSLKKKLDKLQASFQSPSPRNSIINRLLRESPAPLLLTQPVLSCENNESIEFIKSTCDEDKTRKTPKPTVSFSCEQAIASSEFLSPIHPGALRQNRKRTYNHINMDSGRLRKGYNGLGGHSTVLMPAPCRPKKKVVKPVKISKFVRTLTDPALPQL